MQTTKTDASKRILCGGLVGLANSTFGGGGGMEMARKTLDLAEKYGLSEIHSYVWYDTKLNNELGIEVKDNLKIVNGLNRLDSTLRYNMGPTMLYYIYKNIKNYDYKINL